jgi:hypothetical protein
VIAVKLMLEEAGLVHIGPLPSLGIVAAIFATGIAISIVKGKVEDEPELAEEVPDPGVEPPPD